LPWRWRNVSKFSNIFRQIFWAQLIWLLTTFGQSPKHANRVFMMILPFCIFCFRSINLWYPARKQPGQLQMQSSPLRVVVPHATCHMPHASFHWSSQAQLGSSDSRRTLILAPRSHSISPKEKRGRTFPRPKIAEELNRAKKRGSNTLNMIKRNRNPKKSL